MATWNKWRLLTISLGVGLLFLVTGTSMVAQAPAPAAATAAASTESERGMVSAVSGNSITMAADGGQTIAVTVAPGARILQVPVGSTDLKSAATIQLSDIATGDHILVTGKAGETPASFSAVRVILMKSADIAQQQAAEQADWRARGAGGIVSAVDPATGIITLTSGTKKITIDTGSKTEFKRFAGDSVQYQDAKPGTLADIHPKDQLQAKGTKSADGTSVQAEEVVSGAFENLSGVIATIDPATGTITLRDLATKKMVTVDVTKNADLRKLSPMTASFWVGFMLWQNTLMNSQSGRPSTRTCACFQRDRRCMVGGLAPVMAPFSRTGRAEVKVRWRSARSGPCTMSGKVLGARPATRSWP